jgi:anti-anti-sigma factor
VGATSELFRATMQGRVAIVRVMRPTIIDRVVIDKLMDALVGFAGRDDVSGLVVDFHRVKHASSALWGALMKLRGIVRARDGKIALSRLSEDQTRVANLIKLDKLIPIHTDLDEATRACR